MIEVVKVDAKVISHHGTGVVVEFEVVVGDSLKGRYYHLRIPKVLDLREDLKWHYPELFGVRGSPETTKKWEG